MSDHSLEKRLNQIYRDAQRLDVGKDTKLVIMSDCHRGNGGWNDNFAENETLYFTALRHYYRAGYTYIELGDGDELWENTDYRKIIQRYSHIFWLLSQFYREGRLYMIYGNHDLQKRKMRFVKKYMSEYYYPAENRYLPLFPKLEAKEGLVLKLTFCEPVRTMLLLHGHQGEWLNDRFWWVGRWMVHNIWKPLEILGVNNPFTSAGSYSNKQKYPGRIEEWARQNGQLTVGGHTHRPFCSGDSQYCYFNSGSCVHPRCITAIEIEGNNLYLVKWLVDVDSENHLMVKKERLSQRNLS